MKKTARNNHFVPQSYLAGFTDDGTRDGKLFVSDIVSGSVFQTKPRNVAASRDFNRTDIKGQEPDALEKALGEFEGRAAIVLHAIRERGELPPEEEFSYVINLMALLVVRNPMTRRSMNAARRHTARIIIDMLGSDQRLFKHHVAKAKADGLVPQDVNVSFDAISKFIDDEQYSIEISTGESLALELNGLPNTLHLLGSRYWSLVIASRDAPDFVTCDHPVVVVFKDPKMRGPVGYGLAGTEVTFPLNTRHTLLGVLEDPLQPKFEARAEQVALINSRTVHYSDRQIYSRTEEVVVLRGNGMASLGTKQV
jgi:hypothetical protein